MGKKQDTNYMNSVLLFTAHDSAYSCSQKCQKREQMLAIAINLIHHVFQKNLTLEQTSVSVSSMREYNGTEVAYSILEWSYVFFLMR